MDDAQHVGPGRIFLLPQASIGHNSDFLHAMVTGVDAARAGNAGGTEWIRRNPECEQRPHGRHSAMNRIAESVEVRIAGKPQRVQSQYIDGCQLVVTGTWLRTV